MSPMVSSAMPAYAMTAHGNLAEQNRTWGTIVGLDTSKPMTEKVMVTVAQEAKQGKAFSGIKTADILPLLQKNTCTACHTVATKVMGPAFKEIAKKYAGHSDAASYLAGKIKSGGSGVWGSIPMPPSPINEADSAKIAQWLSQGSLD